MRRLAARLAAERNERLRMTVLATVPELYSAGLRGFDGSLRFAGVEGKLASLLVVDVLIRLTARRRRGVDFLLTTLRRIRRRIGDVC